MYAGIQISGGSRRTKSQETVELPSKGAFAGYNAAMIAITKKYIAMRMPEVAASSKRNGVEIYEVEQEQGAAMPRKEFSL